MRPTPRLYERRLRELEIRAGLRKPPRPYAAPPSAKSPESPCQANGRRSRRSEFEFLRCKTCGTDWPVSIFFAGCPTCKAIAAMGPRP